MLCFDCYYLAQFLTFFSNFGRKKKLAGPSQSSRRTKLCNFCRSKTCQAKNSSLWSQIITYRSWIPIRNFKLEVSDWLTLVPFHFYCRNGLLYKGIRMAIGSSSPMVMVVLVVQTLREQNCQRLNFLSFPSHLYKWPPTIPSMDTLNVPVPATTGKSLLLHGFKCQVAYHTRRMTRLKLLCLGEDSGSLEEKHTMELH